MGAGYVRRSREQLQFMFRAFAMIFKLELLTGTSDMTTVLLILFPGNFAKISAHRRTIVIFNKKPI
ncbi:hypothetical protein HED49_14460 [Ochrobactrum daejeonense]|nr:hypothetical protein [Brucella daejeonensis]